VASGQGLGQPQNIAGKLRSVNQLSPDDLLFFSLRRRFFKADSNSSLDLNGRTLGPTFFGVSVVVVVVELDSLSCCSSFSGANSPSSTYSSSWK
jgi:hypothetical protein